MRRSIRVIRVLLYVLYMLCFRTLCRGMYCKNNMPNFNISESIKIEIASGLKYKLYARKPKSQIAFSVSNCFVMRNN